MKLFKGELSRNAEHIWVGVNINFAEKTFACGFQTVKFMKVFSLEAYLLFGGITRDNSNIYFFQSEIQSSQGFVGACKWENLFGLNLESIQYKEQRGCQTVNGDGVEWQLKCAKVSPVVQSSGPVHRASPPITNSP